MPYASLEDFRHRVAAGAALPFNVYDTDHKLLLVRGHVVADTVQLLALCQRGTLVDMDDLWRPAERVAQATAAELPQLWSTCMDEVGRVLLNSAAPDFRDALDEAAEPVAALIDRDPDLAIFKLLRQEGSPQAQRGLAHSVHTAIVARLVAQRLGWPQADLDRAFKAALTMDLAMLELHGVMATQQSPLTARQRLAILEHPLRGVEILEQAGIHDAVWLTAVAQHHEERDGSGYPGATREPSELATLLHRADVYAAKLSTRTARDAKAANEVAREIFRLDPGHPITAALVKEFGIYPPGCFVSLASGETGIVVRRGITVMTPIVSALTDMYGEPLTHPVRRDTAQPLHAITGVLVGRQVRVEVTPERLVALAV